MATTYFKRGDGGGTVKDNYDYDISKLQYPDNLCDSEEYGGHKVLFFINVQAGGAIGKSTDTKVVQPMPGADLPAQKPPDAMLKGDTVGKMLDVLKPKKRLMSAIALYIPNRLASNYSVQWDAQTEGMMTGDAVLRTLMGGAEHMKNAASMFNSDNLGDSARMLLGGAVAGGVNAAQVGAGYGAATILNGMPYAQKALGVTPGQSKAQQLFNGVNFREFDFSYQFAPKTETEAENVLNIIKMFKYHMLPEFMDPQQYLYIYPSEFDVKYFIKDVENKYIEKQVTAVLVSMNIDYTPNNQFMTFANGMPTHINMDLHFKELALASKETQPYK